MQLGEDVVLWKRERSVTLMLSSLLTSMTNQRDINRAIHDTHMIRVSALLGSPVTVMWVDMSISGCHGILVGGLERVNQVVWRCGCILRFVDKTCKLNLDMSTFYAKSGSKSVHVDLYCDAIHMRRIICGSAHRLLFRDHIHGVGESSTRQSQPDCL